MFFDFFERFENQAVHYIKVYSKGVLKIGFVHAEISGANLLYQTLYQLRSKSDYSQDRLWSKIHPRYFTFSYCLIAVPLRTMFKVLEFRSLCLVPKLILFFSWPKYTLNLLSTNQSHKLYKSLSGCFSILVTFLYWKTMEVSSA